MHITIEVLYYFAGIAAVLFTVPSMYRLIVTKKSDELSMTSWFGWLAYQLIALMYSIQIEAVAYSVVNLLWITSYLLMIVLIIKYRKKTTKKRTKNRVLFHWPRG